MYKKPNYHRTKLKINNSAEGESIETKVQRITVNKEPIKDGAPIIFTERKDGVQPSYNVRTDRFEIAVEAMDKVTKSRQAKREQRTQMEVIKNDKSESGDTEPTQATN